MSAQEDKKPLTLRRRLRLLWLGALWCAVYAAFWPAVRVATLCGPAVDRITRAIERELAPRRAERTGPGAAKTTDRGAAPAAHA
jgi:hypothetical protein